MAQSRLPMRKIRDVLRLSAAGLSKRQIAASLGIGPTAAGACLRRARKAGIGWPLPDDLGDAALERRLYPAPAAAARDWRSLPDWPAVHRELRRKGVTLQLVWEEYRATHPDGYGRSRFCELYRAWEGRLSPTMRQAHVAGEKLFVDYAGTTIDIFDATTGEVHACQLFVAALGASSFTYAEATATQSLPDWIGSHTRAFAFFGGVAAMVVSDNLKSGITKACFYEPAVKEVHLKAYADGREARDGIGSWMDFYNYRRPHQAMKNQFPMAVWRAGMDQIEAKKSVDMTLRLDNANALPTYPQQMQTQQKKALSFLI